MLQLKIHIFCYEVFNSLNTFVVSERLTSEIYGITK